MRFEFKTLSLAACGSILLAPLLLDSIVTGRWPFIVLAVLSAHLIMRNSANSGESKETGSCFYWAAGATLMLVSYVFEIDKALYLAGTSLLAGSFLHASKRPVLEKTAILASICAIVPIPVGIEAAVANILSSAEAAIFVAVGQLAGQPLYQVGSQVVLGKLAVTINSDCSGTLLLLPSFLGCLVAASICKRSALSSFVIVFAALPLAISINLIRISFLLFLGLYSPETPIDDIHDILGWITMSLVWVVPIYLAKVADAIESPKIDRSFLKAGTTLSIVLAISFALNLATNEHGQTGRASLPLYVSGWVGEEQSIPPEELRILNADNAVRRKYTSLNGDRILVVTEIFHANTRDAEQHNSAACFRAMGWQTIVLSHENLTSDSTLEHLLVRNNAGQQAVLEVTLKEGNSEQGTGFIRLQIVEASTVSEKNRRIAALTFFRAIQNNEGNNT